MTLEFPGSELAEVITSALLGLDDDNALVNVVVQLPSGQELAVERVWYEPTSARVVLELVGVVPTYRNRIRHLLLEDEFVKYAAQTRREFEQNSAGRLWSDVRGNPLRDVRRDDVGTSEE
jgi:hypothetical protein